jgi:hypothetical protein
MLYKNILAAVVLSIGFLPIQGMYTPTKQQRQQRRQEQLRQEQIQLKQQEERLKLELKRIKQAQEKRDQELYELLEYHFGTDTSDV